MESRAEGRLCAYRLSSAFGSTTDLGPGKSLSGLLKGGSDWRGEGNLECRSRDQGGDLNSVIVVIISIHFA